MDRKTIILLVSLVLVGLFLGQISEVTGEAFWNFWRRPTAKTTPTTFETACTDSDGLDYYTPGTVTYNYKSRVFRRTITKEYNDKCSRSNIIEYYCTDDKLATKTYKCEIGCLNGACKSDAGITPTVAAKRIPVQTICKDPDNLNLEFKGSCIDSKKDLKWDKCIDGKLHEMFCTSKLKCSHKVYECPSGYACQDGKCLKGGVL